MADVPVVDFAPFRDGGVQGKTQVAAAIRAACEGTGFFYLSGHGVPASAMAGIFAASRRFFALPIEERLKVKLTPRENRGYQPLGSRIYADKADAPDRNESYKYQHEFPPDDADIMDGGRVHARNRWPEGLPGWREILIGYYDQMERLTDALLRAFALALDLSEDYFVGFYRKPLTQINLRTIRRVRRRHRDGNSGCGHIPIPLPSRYWCRTMSVDCRSSGMATGLTCRRSPARTSSISAT
jgi:isopenicillin N synthase-like dioxygenase